MKTGTGKEVRKLRALIVAHRPLRLFEVSNREKIACDQSKASWPLFCRILLEIEDTLKYIDAFRNSVLVLVVDRMNDLALANRRW